MENLIFAGPRNKAWISEWGDNIKSGCFGGKDETLDVQSKRIPPKKCSAEMVCLRGKTPLKTPPQTILKKGGVQNPPRYRTSQNLPPPTLNLHT